MDLTDLRHGTFAPLVGDAFRAKVDDDTSVELELIEASQAKGDNRPDHAFSVVFRGPPDHLLPQRTYELEHASLGSLPIFLVPIGQQETGFLYEAVFTRLDSDD